jgi:hypothetical protein
MKRIFKPFLIIALLLALLSMTVAASAQNQGPATGSGSQVVKKSITRPNSKLRWPSGLARRSRMRNPADAGRYRIC